MAHDFTAASHWLTNVDYKLLPLRLFKKQNKTAILVLFKCINNQKLNSDQFEGTNPFVNFKSFSKGRN